MKVAYGLWIGTKLVSLNHDLERLNGGYFALLVYAENLIF